MQEQGITVVSPMWGERKITDRMVFSVIHQFISEKEPFNIHLVLVDDYIEGRGPNNESPYDYYVSDEFKENYDTEHIKITLIKNKEHKYQGESREIGWNAGDYDHFVLVDCDDMLAPNCCDRYLGIINQELNQSNDPRPIACIYGLLYSFSTKGYENNIIGQSIWVQSRCYNRVFLDRYDIHCPTGLNSRQGEDYPFINALDYAIEHDKYFKTVKLPYGENKDCQCTAYWFPNENSLSRQDPHYTQHLAGWTMGSSNIILDYCEKFNKKYGFVDEEDETMKHKFLNMNVYAFYNFLDFLHEVAATDYEPLEEDWIALRDNVARLKKRLKDKYWNEIVYSDVEDMLYNIRHYSDCHFIESWIGTFFDYMNNDDLDLLKMSYQEMRDYCKTLQFDESRHEINAPYVQAWAKRHKIDMGKIKKK